MAGLFPQPREVLRFDETLRSTAPLEPVTDPDVPTQGYELVVDSQRAQLLTSGDAGRRYGEQTVAQLRSADLSLPSIHVRDRPELAVRGFMLDVSRDRVPTRATLARLVDLLAVCRFNHLELYVEHTFAHPGHDVVWRDASPLTGDDLTWLDDLCRRAGIELGANQNCFGHMERWLRHDEYRSRAECPGGFELAPGDLRLPSVLAPTTQNAEFAVELCRNQLRFLSGKRINIGCDETFELGHGASMRRVTEVGTESVYADHVSGIMAPLVADGHSVHFWGDIFRSRPDLLDRLPKVDVTAVAWTYESRPPPSLGGFDTEAAPFAEAGIPFWVAPGTSSWNSLVGRLDNARRNILDAVQSGGALGAGGLLLTDWGDNGHLQPLSVSFPPIVYAGAVAWCAETNRDLDLAATVSAVATEDPTGVTGRALIDLGSMWGQTGRVAINASPLQASLCPAQRLMVRGEADPDAVEELIGRLGSIIDGLSAAKPGCGDAVAVVEELRTAAGLARHGAMRLLAEAGGRRHSAAGLHADLVPLIGRYADGWVRRSRPGGYSDSARHLERTLDVYLHEMGR